VPHEPRFQLLPNASVDKADLLIQPIGYEETVCFRPGTATAPQAILEAVEQLEYYEEELGWSPMKYLWPNVLPDLKPGAGEDAPAFFERIRETVTALPANNLYIGLGGEHSITPAQVQARMQNGTIVIIDAHADLRSAYRGNPWSHACPAWRLHEADYELILIGIRSIFETEAELIRDSQSIRAWPDSVLRNPQSWSELLSALDKLEGPVWLSVDMDGFDPALVPGVGTPQPGGLNWHQACDIVRHLIDNPEIDLRGVDLLELIPEPSQVSQTVAAKLIQKIISRWAYPRIRDFSNPQGAQMQVDYS
jgi:agmatinase